MAQPSYLANHCSFCTAELKYTFKLPISYLALCSSFLHVTHYLMPSIFYSSITLTGYFCRQELILVLYKKTNTVFAPAKIKIKMLSLDINTFKFSLDQPSPIWTPTPISFQTAWSMFRVDGRCSPATSTGCVKIKVLCD